MEGGGDDEVGGGTIGECVGVGTVTDDCDGVGVGLGDRVELEVTDGVGVALPCAEPTFAGGGNGTTGAPANAAFIISCQAAAGRSPP